MKFVFFCDWYHPVIFQGSSMWCNVSGLHFSFLFFFFFHEGHWLYWFTKLYKNSNYCAKKEPNGVKIDWRWRAKSEGRGLEPTLEAWNIVSMARSGEVEPMQERGTWKKLKRWGEKTPRKPWRWARPQQFAPISFVEDGRGASGLGSGGSRRSLTRRHRTTREGTRSSPGTAWRWHRMCPWAIPGRGLHLSLAPETAQGPHMPCQSPLLQLLAQDFTDTGQATHRLLPHGLRHEVQVLLGDCHLDQA